MRGICSLLIQAPARPRLFANPKCWHEPCTLTIALRLSVRRKDGQRYVVDNFIGAAGPVVVRFDWRRWWELDSLAAAGGFGGAGDSTNNRSSSRCLAPQPKPDGAHSNQEGIDEIRRRSKGQRQAS